MAAVSTSSKPQQQPSIDDPAPQSKYAPSRTQLQNEPSLTSSGNAQENKTQANTEGISTTHEQQEENLEEIARLKSKASSKAENVHQEDSKAQFNDALSDEQRGIAPEAAPNIQERQREREKQEKESMKNQPTEEVLVKKPSTTASAADETTATSSIAQQKSPPTKAERRKSTATKTTKTAATIVYADPVKLVRNIEFKALVFIVSLCAVCFLLGRWNFGVLILIATVTAASCAYWYLGRQTDAGSDWRLDKQKNLKTVSSMKSSHARAYWMELIYSFTCLKARQSNGSTISWRNFGAV